MNPALLMQLVINGIMAGALLAVVALGLALIFGVVRIVNFAHGEFVTLGAFATYLLVTSCGLSPLAGIPVSFCLGFLGGWLLHAVILSRMSGRPELDVLMATYALSIVGLGLFSSVFGGDFRNYAEGPSGTVSIDGIVLGWRSLTVFIVCVVLSGASIILLRRARFGVALRALAQNRDAAAALGINVRLSETFAFAFAVGLASAAGSLVSLIGTVTPGVRQELVLDAFVVVVIGGMGSIPGAILASFLIGILHNFGSFYFDDTWARIATYGLLYLSLLLRPQGLAGRAGA